METNDKTKILAERLATFLVEQEKSERDETKQILSAVLSRLDDMNARFERVEIEFAAHKNDSIKTTSNALHFSQEKFQIPELSEIRLPNSNEKACRFEPDKPCDYCSMCSAHGF